MSTTIGTNTTAATAMRYLQQNSMDASSSIGKLSSGSRIVKASDDAASLSIGTKIKADISALKQASVNASQATSMLQVADGGLSQVSDTLARMKALTVQAVSGTLSGDEKDYLDAEYGQLKNQIDTIANTTKFNNRSLLNGNIGQQVGGVTLDVALDKTQPGNRGMEIELGGGVANGNYTVAYDQATQIFTLTNPDTTTIAVDSGFDGAAGAENGTIDFGNGIKLSLTNFDDTTVLAAADGEFDVAGVTVDFQIGVDAASDVINVDSSALGNVTSVALSLTENIGSAGDPPAAAAEIDAAIKTVNDQRAAVGSYMSRFDTVGANLATSIENLDAARSTLMDVDVAAEMSEFTTKNVLTQAATAMLAQANQLPQNMLRLLQ